MRVLDILNLKPRRLNHHEEVYSQDAISEASNRQQVLGGAGVATHFASQSGGGIAAAVDDWASPTVDRGHAGPTVATVRRTTADDVCRIDRWAETPRPADGRGALARRSRRSDQSGHLQAQDHPSATA